MPHDLDHDDVLQLLSHEGSDQSDELHVVSRRVAAQHLAVIRAASDDNVLGCAEALKSIRRLAEASGDAVLLCLVDDYQQAHRVTWLARAELELGVVDGGALSLPGLPGLDRKTLRALGRAGIHDRKALLAGSAEEIAQVTGLELEATRQILANAQCAATQGEARTVRLDQLGADGFEAFGVAPDLAGENLVPDLVGLRLEDEAELVSILDEEAEITADTWPTAPGRDFAPVTEDDATPVDVGRVMQAGSAFLGAYADDVGEILDEIEVVPNLVEPSDPPSATPAADGPSLEPAAVAPPGPAVAPTSDPSPAAVPPSVDSEPSAPSPSAGRPVSPAIYVVAVALIMGAAVSGWFLFG